MLCKKIKISIFFGIFAALCWSIADMFLVGFTLKTEIYSSFTQILSQKNIDTDLAILMIEASPKRLMWGVYLATFSVCFYLLSAYGLFHLLTKNRLRLISILALFIGYATSPLGHSGFAYIGLLSQSIYQTDFNALSPQIKLFKQYESLLNIHWLVSVSFSAFAWLLIFIQTLQGHITIGRKLAFINPLLTAPLIAFIASFFPKDIIGVMFGCASLNISQLIFFTCLFILININENKTIKNITPQ